MKRGMPFFDRFWWLRSAWVIALAAAFVATGWLTYDDIQQPGGLNIGMAVLLLAVYAVIVGLLALAWRQMWKARSRMRTRLAAIEGDQDAVPLARYAVHEGDAPDIVAAPLVVDYPASGWRTPFWSRLRIAAGVLSIPYVVGLLALIFSPWHTVLDADLLRVLGVLYLLCVPSLPELRRSFVLAYRSARRVTASLDGIEWVPVLGRTRFMRWNEARLLEVSRYADGTTRAGSRAERRRYTLYGAETTIWWNDRGAAYDKPSGKSARLLAVIQARTGLVPRSFTTELREDTRRVPPAARPAPPLPPLPPVPVPQPDAGETMQVTAEPGPVYSLATYVTTNRARGIAGGIGALLCLGGAAAAVWTLSMLQLVRVPDVVNGLISWMNIMWATLLGVGALLGCLMLVAAVRAWGTMTIRADALGLRMAGPESSVLLRWNAVAGITYISARNRTMYVVNGQDGASVAWPARVTPEVRAQAEPGAVAVTPDELAAVVAERSGKPVEARRWW